MIVDDEEKSVEVLKKKIERHKSSIKYVYGANSAEQAREIMKKHSIQLLLCDIEMPGESGLEFIEWIRDEKNLSQYNIECIILTCYPEYEFMRKAMQLGCSDYLLKPVDEDELYQVIEKAIGIIREKQNSEIEEMENGNHTQDVVYQKMIPFIKKNLNKTFSVTDIASYIALNPQYTMRLFKKTTGLSILEYVTKERIEQAKRLLETTQYNNDIIAEKIGYVSVSYFIRQFKKVCGVTPREYKKKKDLSSHF